MTGWPTTGAPITNTANVTSRSSACFSAARLHKSSPLSHRPKTDCSRASCSTICLPLKNGKTSSTKRIQTMTPVSWNGGAQWKEVLDAITASVSNINMKLTHEQKEIFNFHFARVFGRASAIHGNQMKSAVTRIAINIFRIISIIALLRSLESLLPGGERSGEPQENIVRTLLNCPGLTPSAHIPQENIADGIVPQFNLSIRTDDFYAVLALVEPLYRHACHILSLLPAGTPTAPSANMTPETLFDCLPLRFTRNEAIDKGEQVGVPAGSVDSLLKRMTERGQLVKVGRGEYEFNARMHTRTCVGVRESASSASLQDS